MGEPYLDICSMDWKLRQLRLTKYKMKEELRELEKRIERLEVDHDTAMLNRHLIENDLAEYLEHDHKRSYP